MRAEVAEFFQDSFFFGALFLFLDRKKGSVGGQGVVKF